MGAHKKPSQPQPDADLDSTAELPVIDDPLSSTDTWAVAALPSPASPAQAIADELGARGWGAFLAGMNDPGVGFHCHDLSPLGGNFAAS